MPETTAGVFPGTTPGVRRRPRRAPSLVTRLEQLGKTLRPTPHVPLAMEHMNLFAKVEDRDDTGGFLKTRLEMVKQLCDTIPNAYWTNQYGNPDAVEAHYELTAGEICADFASLEYVFIGVSTGGTIAGLSRRLKARYPKVRIVAVDTQGSVIFGDTLRKRHIPGVGSSIVPPLLSHASIDDVVLIPERETAAACRELLQIHGLFAGGSSGTVFAAVKRYATRMGGGKPKRPTVWFGWPDRGTPYLDTVFDPTWTANLE